MSSRPGPRLTTRCADDHTRQSRAAKLEVEQEGLIEHTIVKATSTLNSKGKRGSLRQPAQALATPRQRENTARCDELFDSCDLVTASERRSL